MIHRRTLKFTSLLAALLPLLAPVGLAQNNVSQEVRENALRKAWDRFPVIELGDTGQPVRWYEGVVNRDPCLIGGERYTGFRFRYESKSGKSSDFLWACAFPKNATGWYIVRKNGPMKGFSGDDYCPSIYDVTGREFTTQGLEAAKLVPGEEYLMFVTLNDAAPSRILFACTQRFAMVHDFGVGWAHHIVKETFGAKEFIGLGIGFDATPSPDGVKVTAVHKGGPAERAGLEPGDVLTEMNGVSLANVSRGKFVSLAGGPAGSKVTVKVARPSESHLLQGEITRGTYEIIGAPIQPMELTGMP